MNSPEIFRKELNRENKILLNATFIDSRKLISAKITSFKVIWTS